jgi:S-adenosyl methyltransferase
VDTTRSAPAESQAAEPKLFDPSTPNIARVYDYWLGGKDNYEADRAEAERLIAVYPRLPLLAEQGVTQYLDLGCGLPAGQNTYEIARSVHPGCRVVYVDADHCKPGCADA